MSDPGRLWVSPEVLQGEASVFRSIRHPHDDGAVLDLTCAVPDAETTHAAGGLNHRLSRALDSLDDRRAGLVRGLEAAAASYATGEAQVARGLRRPS